MAMYRNHTSYAKRRRKLGYRSQRYAHKVPTNTQISAKIRRWLGIISAVAVTVTMICEFVWLD